MRRDARCGDAMSKVQSSKRRRAKGVCRRGGCGCSIQSNLCRMRNMTRIMDTRGCRSGACRRTNECGQRVKDATRGSRKNANTNANHASKVEPTRRTGRNEMVMLMVIMMIGGERQEGETNEHAMQEES